MSEDPDVAVPCVQGPNCKGFEHGWECPQSNPMGDLLSFRMGPMYNPYFRPYPRTPDTEERDEP